jgi:dimethylamine/trimethylamine dehydrogenase
VTGAADSTLTLGSATGVETLAVDTVVVVGQRVTDDALYHQLRQRADYWSANGAEAVYRVGDCVRPNFIAEAIYSGHRLAREIDADDPAHALPFIRERRLVDSQPDDFVLGGRANGSAARIGDILT